MYHDKSIFWREEKNGADEADTFLSLRVMDESTRIA